MLRGAASSRAGDARGALWSEDAGQSSWLDEHGFPVPGCPSAQSRVTQHGAAPGVGGPGGEREQLSVSEEE